MHGNLLVEIHFVTVFPAEFYDFVLRVRALSEIIPAGTRAVCLKSISYRLKLEGQVVVTSSIKL